MMEKDLRARPVATRGVPCNEHMSPTTLSAFRARDKLGFRFLQLLYVHHPLLVHRDGCAVGKYCWCTERGVQLTKSTTLVATKQARPAFLLQLPAEADLSNETIAIPAQTLPPTAQQAAETVCNYRQQTANDRLLNILTVVIIEMNTITHAGAYNWQ